MRWLHKVIIASIIFFLFVPFLTTGVQASETKQRIYDEADMLTQDEIADLEKLSEKHSKKRKTDFIILTTKEGFSQTKLEKYMSDTVDEKEFGYDKKDGNAVIMTIDINSREVYIAGFGEAENQLSNDRVQLVLDEVAPYLSQDDNMKAFNSYIKTSSKYMNFIGKLDPTNPLYKSGVQLIIALVIGGVVVGIMLYRSSAKITTTARTYQDVENTKLLERKDRYIRTTVTKTRKPKNNNSSGGGRGGSGGGVTGGGRSYSGGGRSF